MTHACPALIGRLLLLLAILWPGAAAAQGSSQPNIRAELVAESTTPRAGETVTLAFVMTPAPGWHGYWKNPGDAGIETSVRWTLPQGVTAGPLAYQVPERLLLAGIMQYVYEGAYAHPVQLTIPGGLSPGTRLPIRAALDWLECTDEVCVPASAELATELVVGDGAVAPEARARFDEIRSRLPRPLGLEGRFELADGRLRLEVPLPAEVTVEDAYFFPLTDGAIDYSAPQAVTREGDRLIVDMAARGSAPPASIEGVLSLDGGRGFQLTATPGTVAAGGVAIGTQAAGAASGVQLFLAALGLAVLGGLILNIMPCVFPILSLKALSLARANTSAVSARREALAYTAGVIGMCLLLGGALLLLRAGGEAAGWAFQLTDPRVIGILFLLTFAIALNLAGLFELPAVAAGGVLAERSGAAGAFWTGALAAFVATPCTGPFMGAALGSAMVLPTAAAMAVFGGLGLGLALPFLLIGFVPAVRRMLPRPGAWMGTLRHILAVPMFLTALTLAWVLGRQAGVDGLTIALLAALLLGLALWWTGRRQASGRHARLGLVPAMALAALLVILVPRAQADATGATASAAPLGAEPFSEARLATLQAEGRPVFAYFTADWCITCKVNERTAIDRDEVAEAFAARNVAVLVGDWTRGDPAIGRFLASHGRSGVPLYLWYPAGSPTPQVLPQLLTSSSVVALAR